MQKGSVINILITYIPKKIYLQYFLSKFFAANRGDRIQTITVKLNENIFQN